jgi:hypothetical protein
VNIFFIPLLHHQQPLTHVLFPRLIMRNLDLVRWTRRRSSPTRRGT